jgi:hypothetical protein
VNLAEPDDHQAAADVESEARGAAAVASTVADVLARKDGGADQNCYRDEQQQKGVRRASVAGRVRHPPWLLPWSRHHEGDRTSTQCCRFDPHGPAAFRPRACPRRTRVRGGQECPFRFRRLQRGLVERGELKERRPVHRCRAHRRLLLLRRNRFEVGQTSTMIDVHLDHPGIDRRRVRPIDDAGREQVGMKRRRHQ